MRLQILFCVETNKKSDTDWVYIKEMLNRFYELGNLIRVQPVYMEAKSNYNSNKVKKEISNYKKMFNGETRVIYCVDTDRYDIDFSDKKILEDIEKYCNDYGYEFVWFCRDVEDVFWNEQIQSNEKVHRANQFRSSKRIKRIRSELLLSKTYSRHKSNILVVLDLFLNRKK